MYNISTHDMHLKDNVIGKYKGMKKLNEKETKNKDIGERRPYLTIHIINSVVFSFNPLASFSILKLL